MTVARSRSKLKRPIAKTIGQYWAYDFGPDQRWELLGTVSYPGWETLRIEESVQCGDELHKGPPYREGGPLNIIRQKSPYDISVVDGEWRVGISQKYVGSIYFLPPAMNLANELAAIQGEGASIYGPTAWKRFRPTKPRADLGQAIAEMRDFPKLFKFALKRFKDLGSNYLNVQFGWLPMLRDFQKALKAAEKMERIIRYIRKNNGKWLRRGGTMKDDTTTTTYEIGNVLVPALPLSYLAGGRQTRATVTKKVTDKVWFDSSMKFYIPDLRYDPADSILTSKLRRHIYGLEISPSLLWELMPWSWFIDWFGNIGDIIFNLSNNAYDNLVAKYAYVMRHRTISWEYSQEQGYADGPVARLSGAKCFVEHKERTEASPFGFGIEWPDFSATQIAILTALGITRFPRG